MSAVMVQPSELASMAATIIAQTKADAENGVRKLMKGVGLAFQHDSPVRSNRARASVQPFVGSPSAADVPQGPPRVGRAGAHRGVHRTTQVFYSLVGAPEFDAAYADWHLGTDAGVVMTVPYARRLANGWSKQQPAGWIDHIIYDQIAQARRVP